MLRKRADYSEWADHRISQLEKYVRDWDQIKLTIYNSGSDGEKLIKIRDIIRGVQVSILLFVVMMRLSMACSPVVLLR